MGDSLENRRQLGIAITLLLIAFLALLDLLDDGLDLTDWPHLVLEATFLALCLGLALYLLRELKRQGHVAAELQKTLQLHSAERDAWRTKAQDYLQGLGASIAAQFKAWKLTPAESQVALLLLKGFSTQEIAVLQERSERTVRQHAIAVYGKAKVAGRAELSAFFLEDLLLPTDSSGEE